MGYDTRFAKAVQVLFFSGFRTGAVDLVGMNPHKQACNTVVKA